MQPTIVDLFLTVVAVTSFYPASVTSVKRTAKRNKAVGGAIEGEGLEPISKDEALAYAKYAGLSPDRFAQAGFPRDDDHWLMKGQEVHGHRVIGRTI